MIKKWQSLPKMNRNVVVTVECVRIMTLFSPSATTGNRTVVSVPLNHILCVRFLLLSVFVRSERRWGNETTGSQGSSCSSKKHTFQNGTRIVGWLMRCPTLRLFGKPWMRAWRKCTYYSLLIVLKYQNSSLLFQNCSKWRDNLSFLLTSLQGEWSKHDQGIIMSRLIRYWVKNEA